MLWRGSGHALERLWRGSGHARTVAGDSEAGSVRQSAGLPEVPKAETFVNFASQGSKSPKTFIAVDRWWEALAQNRSSLACGTPRRHPVEAASSLMYTCYYYHLENCVAASPLSSSSPGRIALDARAVRRVASCLMGNSAIPMMAMQALAWGGLLGPIGAGWCVSPQHSQGSCILPAVRSSLRFSSCCCFP